MWIFLNDAFFSIVAPPSIKPAGETPSLLVRARIKGDIERVFNGEVTETPDRDYRYRALIPREMVAMAIADEARRINYTNFKASVQEDARHDAYARVWGVMSTEQARRHPKPREAAPRAPAGLRQAKKGRPAGKFRPA